MSGRQRGRPRDPRAHRAILEATRELLTSGGYEQLTIEAIASRAGVGKQTLYRWWRSKAAIVAEAALSGYLIADERPMADTGDVAADLRAWLRERFTELTDPSLIALIRGLTAAAAESETDAARLYEQFTGRFQRELVRRLAAGAERGQVRGDADLTAAADAVIGTLLYRVLARPSTTAQDGADGLVELLFAGVGPGTTARPE
jgi:AcrR family transcriptional regulator